VSYPNFAFFEGKIVPYSKAKVGVATHALNYGTGAFGGVRAYWNEGEEQLYVFRPLDHYARLHKSAKLLRATIDQTPEELTAITLELLRKEDFRQDCYIRPLIYKSDEVVGVRLHNLNNELTIFCVPFTRYIENDEAASVGFSAWRRVDDNVIPPRGKISGAYVNSALIKTDAMLSGFDEALVMNEDGHLSEGSAENVFMVRDGVLITPPVTDNILEGITRRTIMNLAKDELSIEVLERSIDRTEVYICDEFFMTGTAAQVTAITSIDHRPVGEGVMGPVTGKLKQMYDDLVRGKIDKYRHWNEPVYVKEPARS
jgi:branched-chain amino acid aminotransferase